MNEPSILVIGNPVDGFEFIGPFPTADHAVAYAEMSGEDRDWWTAILTTPAEEEEEGL